VRVGSAIAGAVLLIGFTATIAQVVLLRELIVVFSGNELSLGLMLASWLFWTAAGSALSGRLAKSRRGTVAVLELVVAGALPFTIYAVRASRMALQTVPGESLGPGAALAVALITLSVFCAASGALFSAGARVYGGVAGLAESEATASVYLLEALGSAAGGVAAAVALALRAGALQIACVLALLNLLAACGLAVRHPRRRIAAAIVAAAAVALAWPRDETILLQRLWPPGYRLLAAQNSAYGNLAVVDTEGARSLYENGLLLFSAPDPEGAEEAIHYALLQHPAPRRVLLIGGGMNGSLGQALQHRSVERLDYVELDPAIPGLARRYFPREWAPAETDPRVRVHVTDGRLYLKTGPARYDAIVVNLPDPQTAQLNRFYTLEFFREAARRLAPDGVLSLRVSGSETYIGPELGDFLRSVYLTLRLAFPDVMAMPGESIHFFAANRAGVLARGSGEILERLLRRDLHTDYVREYYLPFRMSPERMDALEAQLRPQPSTRINRDFSPAAYYFQIALWSSRFHQSSAALFRSAASVGFGWLAGGAAALALLFLLSCRAGSSLPYRAAACCAAAMGCSMMALEILLLLGFQAIYGCVYQQLALLLAAFMAGMGIGAWLALRNPAGRDLGALARLHVLAAASPLALYAALEGARRLSGPGSLIALSYAAFPMLALACGMLGGYQFPIASRVYFSSGRKRRMGAVYALDLAGACAGALLFSVYLVPVFGFLKTALLLAELNLAVAALAWIRRTGRE
jgi:spermidine synthase